MNYANSCIHASVIQKIRLLHIDCELRIAICKLMYGHGKSYIYFQFTISVKVVYNSLSTVTTVLANAVLIAVILVLTFYLIDYLLLNSYLRHSNQQTRKKSQKHFIGNICTRLDSTCNKIYDKIIYVVGTS